MTNISIKRIPGGDNAQMELVALDFFMHQRLRGSLMERFWEIPEWLAASESCDF